MRLTEEQQQLLHAWVDGETTEAEDQIVRELIETHEAQEYIRELRKLRELLAAHGGVNMPDSLRKRIQLALRDETGKHNVIRSPFLFRRLALVAAAAAIVLSLAFVYGPTLVTPNDEDHGGEVAMDDTAPQPATDRAPLIQEPLEGEREPGDAPDESNADPFMELPVKESDGGSRLNDEPDRPRQDDKENGAWREEVTEDETQRGRTISVLNLDRGAGTPFELSVRMARKKGAGTLLAYNDLLLVCNLYGDADLKEATGVADDADFEGNDFSGFDGVEVAVDERRVEDLIAAVDRLADVQSYGEVIVPIDLRNTVEERTELVDEVQELAGSLSRKAKSTAGTLAKRGPEVYDNERPHGYLPPEFQDAHLRRLADDAREREDDIEALQERLRNQVQQPAAPASALQESGGESRKLKLIIRLR